MKQLYQTIEFPANAQSLINHQDIWLPFGSNYLIFSGISPGPGS
ncbi:hypothetical protein [Mariniphaga sp.]